MALGKPKLVSFFKACFVRVKNLILNKVSEGGPNNLSKGDKVTEDYLNSLEKESWLEIRIRDEKINVQLEKLFTQLAKQKNILKEFITSVNSSKKLFTLVNKELKKISEEVKKLGDKVTDDIIKIKLDEVSKSIQPLKPTDKVNDTHLVNLMQYYELVNELNKL